MTAHQISKRDDTPDPMMNPRPIVLNAMSRLETDDRRVGDVQGHDEAPYALSVRLARPMDVPALARIPEIVLLNEPRVGGDAYSAARSAMASIAPGRHRPSVFVAKSNSRLVGFVHFQETGADRRWLGVAIGAATGVYGAGPALEALLRHATIAAGLRGVKRLFAKAPSGAPLVESFLRSNYSAYATETIFMTRDPIFGGAAAAVRPQEPSDAWAVHQLYAAATPKQVQYAEAYTSDRWELRRHAKDASVASWLLEDGNIVVGFVRVLSAGGDHCMEVMHHPDHPNVAKELIVAALSKLRTISKIARVRCAVRGYQAETATALEQRGFEPILEQDLLIKHTTAPARVVSSESVTFPVELIERLPKRAPSFPFGASVGDQSH
jgi:hypothetical protein